MTNTANSSGTRNRMSFGFLRLGFAMLVIISHAPALYDGNQDREILRRLFGTISFGELAVDAFFIISGYLIVSSYDRTNSPSLYMAKRIARIYPGYLTSYLMCVTVVAYFGGVRFDFSAISIFVIIVKAILLQIPEVGPVFDGTPYPTLNGSAWTIAYEFRCYIFVLFLGVSRLLKRRYIILLITVAFVVIGTIYNNHYQLDAQSQSSGIGASELQSHSMLVTWKSILFGDFRNNVRFFALFLAGSCFYLFSREIPFCVGYIVFSSLFLGIGLCFYSSVNIAVALFGSYLIFSAARNCADTFLARINNNIDISYGIYLYAWPINKLILYYFHGIGLVESGILTLAISSIVGYVSWIVVEMPALFLARGKERSRVFAGPV
ncbi:MAG: acyltransferase [Bradyrhizobium sp.]|nr:acyltransferase [Bradyrhizobium sp.]